MVGPTTAELDSINELIRFDHIYVKSEKKVDEPKQLVSVLRPIKPKISLPPAQAVKQEAIVTKSATTEAPVSLNLGEMDLEALTETLEGVVDFDTMFRDLVQEVPIPNTDVTTAEQEFTISNTNTRKRKQDIMTDTPVKKIKVQQSSDRKPTSKINVNVELDWPTVTTPDPLNYGDFMFDLDLEQQDSSSLTCGYLSDEVCSPKSDDSGLLEGSSDWEESFTLFPSLL